MSQQSASSQGTASVDWSRFDMALAQYWIVMKKDLRACILQQARLITDRIIDYTPPLAKGGGGGLSAGSKKWGEVAVDRDVREVFEPLGALPPAWVASRNDASLFRQWAPQHKTNSPKLAALLRQPNNAAFKQFQTMTQGWGMPKYNVNIVTEPNTVLHNQRRPTGGYANRDKSNRVFVTRLATIKKFAELKKKSVGKLKSGWAYGVNQLPSPAGTPRSKAPKYVTRHAGYGQGRETNKQLDYGVKITNLIGDNAHISTQKRVVQRAIDEQSRNMLAIVKRIINRHVARASGSRPNP